MPNSPISRSLIKSICCYLCFCANAPSAEFIPLGFAPNTIASSARGVSDDGTVVTGFSRRTQGELGDREVFRWTVSTGLVGLGVPLGFTSTDRGSVSGDGATIVGGASNDASYPAYSRPFVHTEGEAMRILSFSGFATDVSSDGNIVVGQTRRGDTAEAFYWSEDTGMVRLGLHGGELTSAVDVSADGATILGKVYDSMRPSQAFVWTSETGMNTIGNIDFSSPLSMSADGSVVVGRNREFAFHWRRGSGVMQLDEFSTERPWYPTGVSDSGSVIVGYNRILGITGYFGEVAVVWTDAFGTENLQDALADRHGLGPAFGDWILAAAHDISPNGRYITGTGINPNGDLEAWLVRLDRPFVAIPEPASGGLAALGCASLLVVGARRRMSAT